MSDQKIAVIGASGYIGTHLIPRLLEAGHKIIAVSPNAETMAIEHENLEKTNLDIFDTEQITAALAGCQTVYYLVHMMAQHKLDFALAEEKAALSLREAADKSGVSRVIYLGGLGADEDTLSKHLASRHHTGRLLMSSDKFQTIEFRASMVIGRGSISYDIITNLVHKLPIMTLPSWSKTLTQPIGLNDALSYLVAAISLTQTDDIVIEIGGPEAMSYKELMRRYAAWKQSRTVFVNLPVIPVSIAAWWLNLFTPKRHAKVGRAMVESLANPMVVRTDTAKKLFPEINPVPIDSSFV